MRGGGGVGDRLESPDETNSIFVMFFFYSFGISMGWLVCVFQCTVCVWVFCGDSVDGWLWVFQLSGWHTCIYFWIKGLLIMYTWHLNQQFLRILTLHLHNNMHLNVNLHFVTRFMLLIHCVAR